jgi:predicted secreted hydrolase
MKSLPVLRYLKVASVVVCLLLGFLQPVQADNVQMNWLNTPASDNSAIFRRVTAPQDWQFPQDFGAHEDYKIEWWYYTGNLKTAEGRPFGFQLTFFRQALKPQQLASSSHWRGNQIYSAHFTISDIGDRHFYPFERFSRGNPGLAGAQATPYQVWLEDWSVIEVTPNQFRLQAQADEVALDLLIEPTTPILHGDRGYMIRGLESGNASYYYSLIQQPTTGKVTVQGKVYEVSGVTWKDHEYATDPLSTGTEGWDWFSAQFDNGAALTIGLLRDRAGLVEKISAGTWISPKGDAIPLTRKDFQVNVLKTWKSPVSGTQYPAQWAIAIPKLQLNMEVKPLLPNQELNTATATYWEGAVSYEAIWNDRPLQGNGYVELTGYADRIDTLLSARTAS